MQRCTLRMSVVGLVFIATLLGSLAAQSLPQSDPLAVRPRARITTVVDDQQRIVLRGNRPLLSRAVVDAGGIPPQRILQRMMLVLRPTEEQQRALDALVKAQHDPASPYYHRWLTPDSYGQRFGAATADLERVEEWLRRHGLNVDEVAKSRRIILFSGTAEQVETAFHPALRQYVMNGVRRIANAADPSIPAAMAGVVEGVASLHDFYSRPMGRAEGIRPSWTTSGWHYLAPADFATIYDVRTLYNQGLDGTGQSIAIAGRSNITLNDVAQFRSKYALPAKAPNVILVNSNPGIVSGDYDESMLDVEWAGAIAKGATIDFVTAASTGVSDGIFLAIQYIVNHNVAPVMSLSYGECEAYLGAAANSMVNGLWQQAASQGMSVFVSSGDSGAAGCDGSSSTRASAGKAVNGLCSSPYSTCVGGTQFDDTTNPSLYWSGSNGSDSSSALSYIPEKVWNESGSNGLWSSGGGVSILYSKPTWQNLAGVPADGMRDVPDVSLTSAGHVGYLVVMQGATYYFSGTSAAAPSFAGIMALNVQSAGSPQGNANSTLYTLASRQFSTGSPSVFHDVQSGNNSVPGQSGFSAGTGYDAATGLGSVDAGQLVAHWNDNTGAPSVSLTSTSSSVSLQAGTTASVTLTSTVNNGFSSALTLSVTGLPAGVTASFTPTTIAAPGSGSSSLRLTAAGSAAATTQAITVRASGAGFAASLQLTLTVLPPPPFTLNASLNAATVLPSGTTNITLTTTGNVTFNSPVAFRASGLPATLTASFSPATIASPGSGSSTLTLAASSAAAPGSYSLTVTATAGTLTNTVRIAVTVEGIVLTSSANPAVYGAAVTLSAATFGMPQATIVFYDNGTSLGSAIAPSGGSATFTTTSLRPGTHSITASANSVTSAAIQQSVKAVLTVTANGASRTYGGANPTFSVSYSGWVNGDTPAVLTGAPSLSSTATIISSVGNYPITVKPGTLSAANYSFTFVSGTLTVTKASPVVTLSSSLNPSTYGTRVNFTASITSAGPAGTVVFYDGATSIGSTLLAGSTAVLSTPSLRAGSHSITASLTGSNYNAATSPAVSETVNKATLTVTATGTAIYGAATRTLTPVYRGFVNGESASALTGAPTLSTTATAASPAGVYPITVAAGSLAAANYTLAYVPGSLTIAKAVLTVTAGSATRSFGAANPNFNATYSGWVNGDTASVLSGAVRLTTTAGLNSAVGAYPITPTVGTLSAINYSFRFVAGTLRITQAAPTVTLTSTVNPSVSGARTSFRVTVSPAGTGTVMLYDSGAYLGSASLNGTIATVTVTLRTGSHSLTATLSGSNYTPTASAAIVQTVQ